MNEKLFTSEELLAFLNDNVCPICGRRLDCESVGFSLHECPNCPYTVEGGHYYSQYIIGEEWIHFDDMEFEYNKKMEQKAAAIEKLKNPRTLEDLCNSKLLVAKRETEKVQRQVDYLQGMLDEDARGEKDEFFNFDLLTKDLKEERQKLEVRKSELAHWEGQMARIS